MESLVFLYRPPRNKDLDDLIEDLRETGRITGMLPECTELQELLRRARKVDTPVYVVVWVPPNSLGENLIMTLLEYTASYITGGIVTLRSLE